MFHIFILYNILLAANLFVAEYVLQLKVYKTLLSFKYSNHLAFLCCISKPVTRFGLDKAANETWGDRI